MEFVVVFCLLYLLNYCGMTNKDSHYLVTTSYVAAMNTHAKAEFLEAELSTRSVPRLYYNVNTSRAHSHQLLVTVTR
jgi:hypothetical protein